MHRHDTHDRGDEGADSGRRGGGRRYRHGQPRGLGSFGMFGPPRRGRRSRRGDVRSAVLLLLEEEPRTGYQLIQELSERSGGAWTPSPGSIYPVLAQLQDEGLVAPDASNDGRGFTLTEAGGAEVREHRDRMGKPWEAAADAVGGPRIELVHSFRLVAAAFKQLLEIGTDDQIARATELLTETRRRIYQLLAEDAADAPDAS